MELINEIKLHQNVFFAGLILGIIIMFYWGCNCMEEGFRFGFLGEETIEGFEEEKKKGFFNRLWRTINK